MICSDLPLEIVKQKNEKKIDVTEIVKRIKYYLDKQNDLRCKKMKTLNIINLMKYLCTQTDFLEKNEKFRNVAKNKLNLLKNEVPSNCPLSLIEQYNISLNKINIILK